MIFHKKASLVLQQERERTSKALKFVTIINICEFYLFTWKFFSSKKKREQKMTWKKYLRADKKDFSCFWISPFFCLVFVFILFHVVSAISFAIKAKSERSSLVKAHLMLDCLHIFMRQKLLDRETWKYHFHILEEVWAWHSVICFFQAKMKIFLLFSWKNNFSSLFGAWMS